MKTTTNVNRRHTGVESSPSCCSVFRNANSVTTSMRSWGMTASMVLLLSLFHPAILQAQNRDEGKEIVRGLLRGLVESQLDKIGPRGGRAEIAPPPSGPQPGQPTAEMVRLRPLIASFAQESATLTALLNTDSRRSFAVRKPHADLLQLQTTAVVLQQKLDSERDHRNVVSHFAALNAEWKRISFSLQQCPDLSAPSRQAIDRLQQIDAQYCQILGIAEQFDNRELVRAADLLTTDLRTLVDEVKYAAIQAKDQRRLSATLLRLQEQTQLFANMAAGNAALPAVVGEYQNLYTSWQGLRPELDQIPGRAISRTVSRMQETHQSLHGLLRLSTGVDNALIQQMSENMQRDMVELFRAITLEQMLLLRDSRSISAAADALLGTAQNLGDVIARHEDHNAVVEAWLYLEEAWQLFVYYVGPIRDPGTMGRVDSLAQSVESLRNSLGVAVAYDPRMVSQEAVSLHALADQLQDSVRKWQAQPDQQDATVSRDMNLLEARCRELESLTAGGRNRDAAHHKSDEILVLWQQLRPRILQCRTAERDALLRIADSFTSELVRMHMMLGE